MSLYVLNQKQKKEHNTKLYDWNRKDVQFTSSKKINNQNQNSLRYFSREFILSVSFSIYTTFCLRSPIIIFASVA